MRKFFTSVLPLLALVACSGHPEESRLPSDGKIDTYAAAFNAADNETYYNEYPNSRAAGFLKANIPVFDCPDTELEKTYYFRWWTFRKHIRKTPVGYVVTEFLPDVYWAGAYNTINCPASHHLREARWLADKSIATDYARFWMTERDAQPRKYSFPAADATLQLFNVTLDTPMIQQLYGALGANYLAWEGDHRDSTGLFWQMDDRDGMEISVAGLLSEDRTGYRPTINSYAYADATALAKMAHLLGNAEEGARWSADAAEIKALMDKRLWDPEDGFYKVVPRFGDMSKAPVREQIGYIPWMYGIPDEDKNGAWRELFDTLGFKAPFGPTTTERRDPGFTLAYSGHECQWNGPSWPFATSQTLTAMAECLHRFGETAFSKEEYFETLQTYSLSHRITAPDGTRDQCWIDENINPLTGDWISRTILETGGPETYAKAYFPDRGKDYNHSTFCDLVISGLMGVTPRPDGTTVIEPLLPAGKWDWFCLKDLSCQGHRLTIVFDRDGTHYGTGLGFRVYADGRLAGKSDDYAGASITVQGKFTPAIDVKTIWDNHNHAAFTSIVKFKGRWYCSFREFESHIFDSEGNALGKTRIIASDDLENWESVALFGLDGYDLRDPKLSVTPDGRLMVIMGGSCYVDRVLDHKTPHVCFSEDGISFTAPQPCSINGTPEKSRRNWIWRVTWHGATAYAVSYTRKEPGIFPISLLKSSDGINYEVVKDFDIDGFPNESTVRFLSDGRMVMAVRRDREPYTMLWGVAKEPYTDWSFTETDFRIGGPDILVLDNDNIILAGRSYEPYNTTIWKGNADGNFKFVTNLPSLADCSYPGLAVDGNDLVVTYYCRAPFAQEDFPTVIRLARIPLKKINESF